MPLVPLGAQLYSANGSQRAASHEVSGDEGARRAGKKSVTEQIAAESDKRNLP